jgi:cytochrome c heme-lyase
MSSNEAKPTGCPVKHTQPTTSASKCPVNHASSDSNPLNMMPSLPQTPASSQQAPLSTERTTSSIPRPKDSEGERWVYPSPQQFYNALVRKNKPAPEENIETMVDIHNFLNEACWDEIKKWEDKYHPTCAQRFLLKFQGRPDDLSPLARFYMAVYGYFSLTQFGETV